MSRPFPIRPGSTADVLNDWRKHVAVLTIAAVRGSRTYDAVAAEMFGKAEGTRIMKSAVEPGSTTGWGGQLANTRVGAFLRIAPSAKRRRSPVRPRAALRRLRAGTHASGRSPLLATRPGSST